MRVCDGNMALSAYNDELDIEFAYCSQRMESPSLKVYFNWIWYWGSCVTAYGHVLTRII